MSATGLSGVMYQKLVAGDSFNVGSVLNDTQNRMIERMIIECNTAGGGGAINIQLPTWAALQSVLNFEISIVDTGNNAGTNNIVITPGSGNTINNNATYTINTNKGAIFLIGGTPSNWSGLVAINANTSSGGGSGTVTTFSAGNLSPLFASSVANATTTPALTFTLSTQVQKTFFAGPASGADAAPTFRALVAGDLPAGTGTVTSFSAGDLSPLFTTSEANPTTTPALSFTLNNTEANFVFAGPASGAAGTPSYRSLVKDDYLRTASAALDFPSTGGRLSADLTVTLTGAVVGDLVILGVPNDSIMPNSCFTAWVSATNTVTVRFNNYSVDTQDPASGTFTVAVFK